MSGLRAGRCVILGKPARRGVSGMQAGLLW
jgi:hypothetical protein